MALINRTDAGGIARLELNHPEKLNALSDGMLAALQDQIDGLAEDRDTRVVVISGAGKAFCAGHDLKEMQAARQAEDGGRAAFKDLFDRCAKVMTGLTRLPQPVIAQVHGIATAAGCQLVATCDLAVADEHTRFGVNGVNIGLFCSTPMVALSRNLPRKQAFEMLVTGDFLPAAKALELGLINRIAPEGELAATADTLAAHIASKLPAAVRIGKRSFYDQLDRTLEAAYEFTGDAMVENMADADTAEGIQAFLEKRPPDWH